MRSHWHRLLIVAVLTIAYASTLAPGINFSDGPEITTAITTLGVMHPTGYPIFTVLVHGFNRLLAVDIEACVKVEIFNLLCAIGAALLTVATTEHLIGLLGGRREHWRQASQLAAGFAGLALGLSAMFWAQVRVPEVYAFHVLLVTGAGYAWIQYADSAKARYALTGAWLMGMGLAHHVTMVYMLPAAFVLLLVRRPRFFISWQFPVACILGFIPLLSYGYLIWANENTTGLPWGGVHDWDSVFAHMTGKQYRGFLTVKPLSSYYARIAVLPKIAEKQFLATGCVLLPMGALLVLRGAWRAWLFLVVYILLNIGHGVMYAVGDYGNYYLPAMYGCALLMGVALWWLQGWALTRRPDARWWLSLLTAATFFTAAAITAYRYKQLKRLPLTMTGTQVLTAALAIAAVACLVAIFVMRRRPTRIRTPRKLLPLIISVGCIAGTVSNASARAQYFRDAKLTGASYSTEIVDNIPPGSLFLTQGDGYLFSMWYQHHVLGRGIDFATVDLGNVRTTWYANYLRRSYPLSCDLLNPRGSLDRCTTFADRKAMKERRSWVGGYVPYGRIGPKPPKKTHPLLTGNDPRCSDKTFKLAHRKECKCYGFGEKASKQEQVCIYSPEAGGIVVRTDQESVLQRLIEDHINVRPVFERNVLTFQIRDKKANYRDWKGPGYQRVSAQYATIVRGRYSQVVWRKNVDKLDPCSRKQFEALATPTIRKRRRLHVYSRHPYAPNHFPRLIQESYLSPSRKSNGDFALRRFMPGEHIYMHFGWFETIHYDSKAADRRGKPLHHGLRVCMFDEGGERVSVQEVLSGHTRWLELPMESHIASGRYHLQACSMGEVGKVPIEELKDKRCVRALLEFDFNVGG
jgi:hypothetical protein